MMAMMRIVMMYVEPVHYCIVKL